MGPQPGITQRSPQGPWSLGFIHPARSPGGFPSHPDGSPGLCIVRVPRLKLIYVCPEESQSLLPSLRRCRSVQQLPALPAVWICKRCWRRLGRMQGLLVVKSRMSTEHVALFNFCAQKRLHGHFSECRFCSRQGRSLSAQRLLFDRLWFCAPWAQLVSSAIAVGAIAVCAPCAPWASVA